MRRNILSAILAVVLVPSTVVTVIRMMPEPPPSVLAFPSPTHRLAVAVEAAMRSELTSVAGPAKSLFWQPMTFVTANGSFPAPSQVKLPEDDSCFWMPGPGGSKPILTQLRQVEFSGKARDGRTIKATVKVDPFAEGSVADFHGDAGIAQVLSAKIAERLAHPQSPHGSPEDRAVLRAFFGPVPATVVGVPPVAPPSSPAPDPAVRKAGSPELDVPPGPR